MFNYIIVRPFTPLNWFWLADDERVYASAKNEIVTITDPDYLAFLAASPATIWPRDTSGNQTNAALQAVLTEHGLTMPS